MRSRLAARAALAAMGVFVLGAGVAQAHPGDLVVSDSWLNSGKDVHQNSHGAATTAAAKSLAPTGRIAQNVEVVGKLDLFADGFEQPGRVADVSAKGNYAYLTMFYEPVCARGGVQIVDITDLSAPKKAAYIPSHTDTYAGEGSQVISMNTAAFKGDVLIYQNEICPGATNGVGGVTLVDVTNPKAPKKLVEGFGDFTTNGKAQTKANETHSAFAWADDGRVYTVLIDDEEETDVDIIDITNPSRPKFVHEFGLDAETQQPPGAVHGDAVFSHDMVVKEINGRDTMLMNYWDGGYVKLDVEDPRTPRVLAQSDYPAVDPVLQETNGTVRSPEGNGHQAEFTKDDDFVIGTDEDFNPYRIEARITSGAHEGQLFTAVNGDQTPPINKDNPVVGDTEFVGLGCETIPTATTAKIAVIERGVCDFQVKIDLAEAAGYDAVIVFNRTGEDGCETLVTMLATSDIPAIFVSRTDGFRILGRSLAGYTCQMDAAGTGTSAGATGPAESVDMSAIFDGWGYVHLFNASTMRGLDQYWVPESQNESFAEGYGDLSVHEVATDPARQLAYLSYYAGGFRVLSYRGGQLVEKGKFIEHGGSNFWGVEIYRRGTQQYVLGSDRDIGLYVFRYTGRG